MANFLILDESIVLPVKNVFAFDSASASESVNSLALFVSDSATFNEFKSIALVGIDSGLLIEKQSNALSVFDNAALIEKIIGISNQGRDSLLISEFASYQTVLSSNDSSSMGDSSGFNADSPAQDSGSASDFSFINVQALANDSSLFSEDLSRILVSISDNFSLTELGLSNALVNLDTATLLESVFYSALVNGSDSFNQDENVSIDAVATSTDSNSFFEFFNLSSAYLSSDSATLLESVINALANEDQGTFAEFISGIGFNNSDDLFLAEIGQYEATIDSNDSSEFYESYDFVDAGLPAQDFFNLSDFALISAELASNDSSSLLEELPSIELSVSDQGNLTENEIFISLSSLDVVSLEENIFISSEYLVEDSFIAEDRASADVFAQLSDSLSAFDEILLLSAGISSSDESILFENVANDVFISEEFNFEEFVNLILSAFDFSLLYEEGFISTDHFSEELFSVFDQLENIFVDGVSDSAFLQEFIDFININGIQDSLTLEEFPFIETILGASDEQYQLDEQSSFEADSPAIDSAALNDNVSIDVLIASEENILFQEEVPLIGLSLSDTFYLTENASNSLINEDLSILDEFSFADVSVIASEFVNIVENIFISTNTDSQDQFLFADIAQKSALADSTDSATSIEENLGIIVSISDSGLLSEFVAIEVSVEEYIQLQENTIIGFESDDFLYFVDASNNQANLKSTDSANIEESDLFVLLSASDLSIANDINREIGLSGSKDFIIFTETEANANVLKDAQDSLFFVEISKNISFSAYELITYKERTGIWKRAPIVIDINTDPTIHGTVTGDPVIIGTAGGTVPILM